MVAAGQLAAGRAAATARAAAADRRGIVGVGRGGDGGGVIVGGDERVGRVVAVAVEQVVGQLDILAQTVAMLEQRLSMSEDRNARLEGLLKQMIEQA